MTGSGLPELIVIGAQKCATTSLWHALDAHPDITMASGKETQFFLWYHEQGAAFYDGMFDPGARVRGEACPDYTALPHSEGVAGRIRRMVPEARLVYLVRDPVERVVSHWVHAGERGRETRALDEVVAAEDFPQTEFAQRSRYWWQLQPFLDAFGPDRILVLLQEELLAEPRAVLDRLFRFAGVDPAAAPLDAGARRLHVSSAKRRPPRVAQRVLLGAGRTATDQPPSPRREAAVEWVTRRFGRPAERPEVAPATRERIMEHVHDDVAALAAHLGRPLWGVAP